MCMVIENCSVKEFLRHQLKHACVYGGMVIANTVYDIVNLNVDLDDVKK